MFGRSGVPAKIRANAPLHFIFANSLSQVREMVGNEHLPANRFRANGVVEMPELEAFKENELVGTALAINGTNYRIDRLTRRCITTGIDQLNGENMKDVPKIFQKLDKVDRTAVFGVYAHPELEPCQTAVLSTGDTVDIV